MTGWGNQGGQPTQPPAPPGSPIDPLEATQPFTDWQVAPASPPQQPQGDRPKGRSRRKWVIAGVVGVLAVAALASLGGDPSSPGPRASTLPSTADLDATAEPAASSTGNPNQSADAEVSEEPTAEPTEQPDAAAFKAIILKGKGDKIAKFKIPEDTAAIADISEKGTSNFIVEAIDDTGSTNDLLVNEIGSYRGTVLFDEIPGQHTVALKIQSNGTWRIAIKPVSSAKGWDPTTSATGKGAMVLRLTEAPPELAVITIKHKGRANFIVEALGAGAIDLLINEIGRYSGETILPATTQLVRSKLTAHGRSNLSSTRARRRTGRMAQPQADRDHDDRQQRRVRPWRSRRCWSTAVGPTQDCLVVLDLPVGKQLPLRPWRSRGTQPRATQPAVIGGPSRASSRRQEITIAPNLKYRGLDRDGRKLRVL